MQEKSNILKRLWRKFYGQVAILVVAITAPIPVIAQTVTSISVKEAGNWATLISNHGLGIMITIVSVSVVIGIFKWIGNTINKILEQASKDAKDVRDSYSVERQLDRKAQADENDKTRKSHADQIKEMNVHFDNRNDKLVEKIDEIIYCYVDKKEREDVKGNNSS